MSYGRQSLEAISQCHPDLQRVAHESMRLAELIGWDLSCSDGHRNKAVQNAKYPRFTQVKWPDSEHNTIPSNALHIQRYPREWPQENAPRKVWMKQYAVFYMTHTLVMLAAHNVGVKLRGGSDWDGDGEINDQHFDDCTHFERLIT